MKRRKERKDRWEKEILAYDTWVFLGDSLFSCLHSFPLSFPNFHVCLSFGFSPVSVFSRSYLPSESFLIVFLLPLFILIPSLASFWSFCSLLCSCHPPCTSLSSCYCYFLISTPFISLFSLWLLRVCCLAAHKYQWHAPSEAKKKNHHTPSASPPTLYHYPSSVFIHLFLSFVHFISF